MSITIPFRYLESYDTNTKAYSYKANSAWESWLKTQTTYVKFDTQGYVTWVEGASAAEFAKLAQQQLYGKTADATATASSKTVKLSNLNLGYYLLDTTLGTLCSLDTTNPDVVMEEKNEKPSAEKEVQEDSTDESGDSNDADIKQTVNYKATITVQAGAENYALYDSMSDGLTWSGTVSVAVGGKTVASTNYDVKSNVTVDDVTYDFVVEFKNSYIQTLSAGTQIVVTYSATLNENAVVGLPGNPNEITLKYGDENHPSWTPVDETITYTWDMDVLKYANGVESNTLTGVKFVLLNNDKTKVATVVNGKLTGWVAVPDAGEDGTITWPANTTLTTDANGKISIDGLDADTYYLRETEALPGYNKLSDDVEVKITGATKNTETETLEYKTVEAKVNNQSGTELPSTGGIGTTILYTLGGILVLAAVVLLVTKKRMSVAE